MFEKVIAGIRAQRDAPDTTALASQLVSDTGELTLVHVHVVATRPAPDSGAVGAAAKCRYALAQLSAVADELPGEVHVECVEARSVRRGLHELASARRADLLVVSASHNDELARDFAGDDARQLLQDPPCAVAVAPAGYAVRAADIRRIGVAYDESRASERALTLARSLADEHHAALSAFEAVGEASYHQPWNVPGELRAHVVEARQRLDALSGVEAEARFGQAVEELARYGESVDLLVVGSHNYRPVDRVAEGTTAQRLAERSSAPLLVLSSNGGRQ